MGGDGKVVPCKRGEPVRHGAHLRLQHLETGKWLHSHSHRSPLSNNYEVSAFGKADESNSNDNWVVDAQGKAFWERGSKARSAEGLFWGAVGLLPWGAAFRLCHPPRRGGTCCGAWAFCCNLRGGGLGESSRWRRSSATEGLHWEAS